MRILPLLACLIAAPLAAQGLTPSGAKAVFKEASTLAARDGSRLWGRSLEGPLLLADTDARRLVANVGDPEGRLQAAEGVFQGALPRELGVANTAVAWAGQRWTLLHWPLVEDAGERAVLLAHESFHRIQPGLGLWPGDMPECVHLGSRDGRFWLRLEMRALAAALQAKGAARKAALADALAFRARRQSLFPNAESAENALETAEGLAEYTGVRVGLDPVRALARTVAQLKQGDQAEQQVRAFAYFTGPAFGLLLDEARPTWRAGLKAEAGMAGLLGKGDASRAEAASGRYGAAALAAEEDAREVKRLARVKELRTRFVEGPVLTVSMGAIVFNPTRQEAHASLGIFHPTLRLTCPWGILEVTDGALMTENWGSVRVQAPQDPSLRPVKGPGWTLELKEGWILAPGRRSGDWVIRKG